MLMIKGTVLLKLKKVALAQAPTGQLRFEFNCLAPVKLGSVSDPHMLNAGPDPRLWLNTDPRFGSQYLILFNLKNIFNCSLF